MPSQPGLESHPVQRPSRWDVALRTFAATLLLIIPICHSSLHRPLHKHLVASSGQQAATDHDGTGTADHDEDCPICTLRIDESLAQESGVHLDYFSGEFTSHNPCPVAFSNRWKDACAIPRAPPAALNIFA